MIQCFPDNPDWYSKWLALHFGFQLSCGARARTVVCACVCEGRTWQALHGIYITARCSPRPHRRPSPAQIRSQPQLTRRPSLWVSKTTVFCVDRRLNTRVSPVLPPPYFTVTAGRPPPAPPWWDTGYNRLAGPSWPEPLRGPKSRGLYSALLSQLWFYFLTSSTKGYKESIVIVQKSILSFLWKYPFWGILNSTKWILENICIYMSVANSIV